MIVARPLPDHAMCPLPRVAYGALLALVISSQTGNAAAQPNQSFELEWNSPSSCPQQLDVNEQIRSMLGAAPGATLPSGLRAKGELEPIAERFQLTLTVRVGQTERSRVIVSDDCTSLGKAAAVVLGLLIRREHESGRELSDSDLGSDFQPSTPPREPVARKTPPAHPDEPPKPHERVAPAQTHDASTPRSWHVLVMVPTFSVDYLTLPKVGYGVGVAAGVVHGTWRWFASGTIWGTQRIARGGITPYEASFTRKSFEAWVCRGWRSDAYELSPCVLAAVDVLNASASGDRLTTEPRRIVLASAGAGLVGFWHLTERIGFFLSVTGRVAIRRSEFLVASEAEVAGQASTDRAHTIPWGTTLTSIGSEWNF
jgi:hypothetical protein